MRAKIIGLAAALMFTSVANAAVESVRSACEALSPDGIAVLVGERSRASDAREAAGWINVERSEVSVEAVLDGGYRQHGVAGTARASCEVTATIIAPRGLADNGAAWADDVADLIASGAHGRFISEREGGAARVEQGAGGQEQILYHPEGVWTNGNNGAAPGFAEYHHFLGNYVYGWVAHAEGVSGGVPPQSEWRGNIFRLRAVDLNDASVVLASLEGEFALANDTGFPLDYLVGTHAQMDQTFQAQLNENRPIFNWELHRKEVIPGAAPVTIIPAPSASYSLNLTAVRRAEGDDTDELPRAVQLVFEAMWDARYG